MISLAKSFFYAASGIVSALVRERNMRIHTVCMAYMYFFLFAFDFFEITRTQLAVIFLANALVIGGELINTAIENTVDLVSKEHTAYGKAAKDCAAGAVLVFAVFSVLCGIAVMWQPKAFSALFEYFGSRPAAVVLFAASAVIFTLFIFFGFKRPSKRDKGE